MQALGRAVADLGNRRVLAIMLQTLGISVAVFVLLGALLVWLLRGFDPCDSCVFQLVTPATPFIALLAVMVGHRMILSVAPGLAMRRSVLISQPSLTIALVSVGG